MEANNNDAQNISILPVLATKETARLREDYPSIEHLEAGNVASWLVERQDQLLMRAKTGRAEMNISKLITLAGTAVGAVCYATSPLAPIGAVIAGVGYIWAVGRDLNDSHNFAPIPFIRGDFFSFLAAMGDSESRDQWFGQRNEMLDLVLHLDPFERYEFAMLRDFNAQLTDYLSAVEPGKRFYAYRWLLDRCIDYKGVIPNKTSLLQHLSTVAVDPRVNYLVVQVIQEQTAQAIAPQQPRTFEYFEREPIALPEKPTVDLTSQMSSNVGNNTKLNAIDAKATPVQFDSKQLPDLQKLLNLPLNQRATAIIDALNKSGFDLAKCIQDQITVIAGNQRGGKGTLMAILAILSKALEPQTKIHYFTAGDDIYPFKCDRLVCRLSFPKLDGTDADKRVALFLFSYLKAMDNARVGEYDGIILVIDEAVALSGYLDADQKEWMVKYLLTRASKKGAQIFVVLHGKHLSTWVGKNTNGMADTFKSGVSFIGCESTSVQVQALKKISVATGRYFLADPDAFDKSILDGEIGMIPDWMKIEKHPVNNQPDPARTLLSFFPELVDDSLQTTAVTESNSSEQFSQMDTVTQLESLLSLEAADVEIKEEIDNQFLNHIIVIISTSSQPVSFNAIRISKFWERNWGEKLPGTSKLRKALSSLIETEKITGNEKDGYTLTNKN